MLVFGDLSVKGYHMWQDTTLPFHPGLTQVYGPNRSGKTALFHGLDQILMGAQAAKRGTSLAQLPKGCQIGLHFTSHDVPWQAKLSPTLLSLNRDGEDQRGTGKKAPRELVAATLGLPKELFDSTIHVIGEGRHPLITMTPTPRLEWLAAVLDLTDAYDEAARRVARDLDAAERAQSALNLIEREIETIPPRTVFKPSRAEMRAELKRERADLARYTKGVRLLDSLRDLRVEGTAEAHTARGVALRHERAALQRELNDALAYEAESDRAALVRRLRDQLAALPEPGDISLRALTLFNRALTGLTDEVGALQQRWASSAADRTQLTQLRSILADAPDNLHDLLVSTDSDLKGAQRQEKALHHAHGSNCPVCRAKLDERTRNSLIADARTTMVEARNRLAKLERLHDTKREAEALQSRVVDLDAPPAVDLRPMLVRATQRQTQAAEYSAIQARLADLRTSKGESFEAPTRSVAALDRLLADTDAAIAETAVAVDHAHRGAQLRAELEVLFGAEYDARHIRDVEQRSTDAVETLITRCARADTVAEEDDANDRRYDTLEMQAEALRLNCERVVELREVAAAVGRRGMRLSKVYDLASAFQASFNDLVPLLWDKPFRIELEVTEGGLDLFAVRSGVRSDLHSLSGSEGKVFKLLTALSLIRLLPDRLRCNAIILDELEANMDPTTKQRFVAEYLPTLRKYIDTVILVSPLNYAELALAPDHLYEVVPVTDSLSRLEKR